MGLVLTVVLKSPSEVPRAELRKALATGLALGCMLAGGALLSGTSRCV